MVKQKRAKRTNIFVVDEELWAWAQYKAKILGYDSASDYLFDLIALDKQSDLIKKGSGEKKPKSQERV